MAHGGCDGAGNVGAAGVLLMLAKPIAAIAANNPSSKIFMKMSVDMTMAVGDEWWSEIGEAEYKHAGTQACGEACCEHARVHQPAERA